MTSLNSLFGNGKPEPASEAPRPKDDPAQAKREMTPQEKLKASLGGLKFAPPPAATEITLPGPKTIATPPPTGQTASSPPPPVVSNSDVAITGVFSQPDVRVADIGKLDVDLEEEKQEVVEGDEMEQLARSLQALKDSFDHPEIVGDAIRNVMVLLQNNPFLRENMHPEDCGSMVKALRESYGRTIAKKDSAKTKRITKAKEVDSIVDALGALGI